MEALAAATVGYLVKAAKDNKDLNSFGSDFMGAVVKWVRPLFLIDETIENEDLKDFKEDPDDEDNQQAVKTKIKKDLKKNPERMKELQAIIAKLEAANEKPAEISIKQTHYGSGDNVGRDKIVKG